MLGIGSKSRQTEQPVEAVPEPTPEPAPEPPPPPAIDLGPLLARIDTLERQVLALSMGRLPDSELWRGQPPLLADGDPGVAVVTTGTLCREAHYREPWFSFWTEALGEALRYHRKLWEFVFVCQVLHERGVLEMGSRGLGFGVGEEPLSAYFASRGCRITATDLPGEDAERAGWTKTAEHAAGKETLRRPNLCDEAVFDAAVDFRTVDMNAVPDDLTGFDFCWSACALEHLGSIEAGLAFIRRSIETLKPGGLAVHTTEFNLTSNNDTVSEGGTVLFRKRDFEALIAQLRAQGHEVSAIDYDPGDGPIERYIDMAPYRPEPHLKLALDGFATTSIGLFIRRG